MCIFRKQLSRHVSSMYPNSSFSTRGTDLPRHRLLARLKLQDINFLLWQEPQIQSESGYLLTVTPLQHHGHFVLASQDCCNQGSQLRKIGDDNSPPMACTAPSGTMKSGQQGGSFQMRSSFISPCSATKACAVFSNRASPSSFGWQPTAVERFVLCWQPTIHKEVAHLWHSIFI